MGHQGPGLIGFWLGHRPKVVESRGGKKSRGSCQLPGARSMTSIPWHMNDTWMTHENASKLTIFWGIANLLFTACCEMLFVGRRAGFKVNVTPTVTNSTRPRSRNIHFLALRWHYLREKDITSNYSLVGSPWVNSKHPTNWPRIINSIATCWTTAMSFTPPEARLDARQRSIWSFPYFNIQKMIYRKSQSL